ncbi:MAG: DUF58 domain-containing protein, partial [Steroidobacteraceae bacterium]
MSLRRNALLLILLTGVLAVLGEWSPDFARAWCLPGALLLLGLAYEAAALGRCTLELHLLAPERWPLGRQREVRCSLRQSSRRSLWSEVLLSAPEEFAADPCVVTLRLPPDLDCSAALSATARRLGLFSWPAPLLRLGGPLGLAWWSRRMSLERAVTVVPDLIDRPEQAAGTVKTGAMRGRGIGAGLEILQLRDYRRGDPLRVIDWKASARRGRLVSRDLTEDQHLEVIVAVDAGRASGLGAGEIDRLGLYVNAAARLAQRAAILDDAVGVLVFAAQPLARLAPARGTAAVIRIRNLLTACRVHPGESNPVLAAARIRSMAERRCFVVILTDLEDASAGEQLLQAVRLLAPKHFALVAGFESAQVQALSSAAAAEPLGAYRALAALEYQHTVAANVRALRAAGAAALT